MLALADGAPLHRSLAGCPYCENWCYDHYLEWRWREAAFVCPAAPRAEASFRGGMTEQRGVLRATGEEGYHARLRAGTGQLSRTRVERSQFVDDVHRRKAARLLRWFALWAAPAIVLNGIGTHRHLAVRLWHEQWSRLRRTKSHPITKLREV